MIENKRASLSSLSRSIVGVFLFLCYFCMKEFTCVYLCVWTLNSFFFMLSIAIDDQGDSFNEYSLRRVASFITTVDEFFSIYIYLMTIVHGPSIITRIEARPRVQHRYALMHHSVYILLFFHYSRFRVARLTPRTYVFSI